MTIQIKHATTAVGTEAGDGEIGKTEWNEAHTLTLETGKLLGRTTAGAGAVEEVALLDEDDMASDSATAVPTQQSVKAYVDAIPTGATGVVQYVPFTSSGTFTKATYTGARCFEVIAQGPGGAGANGSTANNEGGGGGGGGGQAIKILNPADVAASVTVTINSTKAEFAHSTAVVGNAGATATGALGGAGGTATGGDLNFTGQPGRRAVDNDSSNGQAEDGANGGDPMGLYNLGAGGQGGRVFEWASAAGNGYGGGGGGGAYDDGGSDSEPGAAGAPGIVIVKVYY